MGTSLRNENTPYPQLNSWMIYLLTSEIYWIQITSFNYLLSLYEGKTVGDSKSCMLIDFPSHDSGTCPFHFSFFFFFFCFWGGGVSDINVLSRHWRYIFIAFFLPYVSLSTFHMQCLAHTDWNFHRTLWERKCSQMQTF